MRLRIHLLRLLLVPLALGAGGLEAIPTDEARHLLSRTGFGATPAEIEALAGVKHEQAVTALVERARARAAQGTETPAPIWVDLKPPGRKVDDKERKERFRQVLRMGLELKGWWVEEMARTETPFLEHMTLFWHNHFTSSLRKVKWAPLLWQQNQLLRRHALGNYRELLHQVARDPAMVIYLDSVRNKKGKPNENFARELLELFTLGEGNYSEADVKAAARAFTGWSLERESGSFRFRPWLHDRGEKEFMGRKGRFDGDDIIDIILEQPGVALHITRKAWREFVSPEPDPQQVEAIARAFRDSGYEISVLMRQLLASRGFRDPGIRGHLIKSPVDLLVGTVRTFEIPLDDYQVLALASRRLGQDLFDPPNVKGWPGGAYWIDSATLAERRGMLERLLQGDKPPLLRRAAMRASPHPDLTTFVALARTDAGTAQLAALLLALPPVDVIEARASPRERLEQLLLDPAYQVK